MWLSKNSIVLDPVQESAEVGGVGGVTPPLLEERSVILCLVGNFEACG